MKRMILLITCLLFPILLYAADEQVYVDNEQEKVEQETIRYIKENLYIFMHAGPNKDYRIIGAAYAGDKITIIEENTETEYMKIITSTNKEGWVPMDQVTTEAGREEQIRLLQEELSQADQNKQSLASEKEIIMNELAAKESEFNKQLSESQNQTEQLQIIIDSFQNEKDKLSARVKNVKQQEHFDMLIYGGGIAGVGVLLGWIVSGFRRSSNYERW